MLLLGGAVGTGSGCWCTAEGEEIESTGCELFHHRFEAGTGVHITKREEALRGQANLFATALLAW